MFRSPNGSRTNLETERLESSRELCIRVIAITDELVKWCLLINPRFCQRCPAVANTANRVKATGDERSRFATQRISPSKGNGGQVTDCQKELTRNDLAMLQRSFITPELARQARLFRVDSREGGRMVGRNGNGDYSGIIFPYRWP